MKNISRANGSSSVASAAYRSNEKLHDERVGLDFDYSRKKGGGYSEIILPDGAPEWMGNRLKLWNAVESSEKRKDARLSKEIEVALPKELTNDQQVELIREFVKRNFTDKGIIADVNIHLLENNPHAHIMLTTREIGPDGFGKKITELNSKNLLLNLRKDWADTQNEHLKRNGFDVTVDHRSNTERGINLEPQIHLGPLASMPSEKTKDLDRMREYDRIARENGERIIKNPNLAFDYLTQHQATFTQADIWRFINSHSLDREQFKRARFAIENSSELVELGIDNGVTRFTTQAMLFVEDTTFKNAKTISETIGHKVGEPIVQQTIQTRTLTDEQEQAFRSIVSGSDLVSMIGRAGTGKSYTLDAVREAFETQGFTVRGAALSGIAAEGLQESSGIESQTVHRMLWDWDNGRGRLGSGSVLVIDEAGMLGTRQMNRIMGHVREAGAKVVLVGDYQQLQPIDSGAAFRGVVDRHGATELTDIRRQNTEWQKNATVFLSRGEIGEAVDLYHNKRRIRMNETFDDAKSELIRDWSRHRKGETSLILAGRKLDVADLNRMAREVLKEAGKLGANEQTFETVRGKLNFAENDRIMFLRNERSLDVKNGSLGTVESITPDGLLVKLDNGTTVAFDSKLYRDFDHGYATTVHKSQGGTVDRSFVLASRHFDRHMTYVALSRHREDVNLYSSKDKQGFANLEEMKTVLGRTREKVLASDYAVRRGISADPDGATFAQVQEVKAVKTKNFVSYYTGIAKFKTVPMPNPAEMRTRIEAIKADVRRLRADGPLLDRLKREQPVKPTPAPARTQDLEPEKVIDKKDMLQRYMMSKQDRVAHDTRLAAYRIRKADESNARLDDLITQTELLLRSKTATTYEIIQKNAVEIKQGISENLERNFMVGQDIEERVSKFRDFMEKIDRFQLNDPNFRIRLKRWGNEWLEMEKEKVIDHYSKKAAPIPTDAPMSIDFESVMKFAGVRLSKNKPEPGNDQRSGPSMRP